MGNLAKKNQNKQVDMIDDKIKKIVQEFQAQKNRLNLRIEKHLQ